MAEEMKQQAAVRSFRVTDEVMAQFKGIQEEMGLTQDGALKMLVQAYEFEAAKNAIPDRETEIANFQAKAGELVAAFLNSLQLNQDAEARARAEVDLQMQSKDKTIATLHEKLDTLKAENAQIAVQTETVRAENKNLSEALTTARNGENEARSALSDKERIIAMQKQQISTLEDQTAELEDVKAHMSTLEEDLQIAHTEIAEEKSAKTTAVHDVAELREQISKLGADHAQELAKLHAEHERDLQIVRREAEAERRQAVLEAREEAQAKIEGYIAKIEAKDEEIARLRAELSERKLKEDA